MTVKIHSDEMTEVPFKPVTLIIDDHFTFLALMAALKTQHCSTVKETILEMGCLPSNVEHSVNNALKKSLEDLDKNLWNAVLDEARKQGLTTY